MYEAKKSFAIVLTMSRCHFDEMVTAHRNEVLTSFCQSLFFSSTAHLTITFETLIQGKGEVAFQSEADRSYQMLGFLPQYSVLNVARFFTHGQLKCFILCK